MPKAEAMERMLSRVPADFMFTAKISRTMTHEIDPKNWRSQVKKYLRSAVEFRHRSWADDKVVAELEKRRVVLVAVDIPDLPHLFPTRTVITNPELFYVRFHRRNALGSRSGKMQKQFDFDYSYQELQSWSERLFPKWPNGRARVQSFSTTMSAAKHHEMH